MIMIANTIRVGGDMMNMPCPVISHMMMVITITMVTRTVNHMKNILNHIAIVTAVAGGVIGDVNLMMMRVNSLIGIMISLIGHYQQLNSKHYLKITFFDFHF